ncbi:hypothetical protein F5Y19DRAFT_83394 [Xylariaceae sp. FL1651]|nr:hypothetical protein F5Y19DRAFT_83394 [Xylariaceae sp. FL1651]
MGLGAKLKEALSGDKDRKDTSHYDHDSGIGATEQSPGAYTSDEVPRGHYQTANDQWYASEPTSSRDPYAATGDATTQDPRYTYGHKPSHDPDGVNALDHTTEAPRTADLRKPVASQSPGKHHRKTGSKDSSTRAHSEKSLPAAPAPYWGDTPALRRDDKHARRGAGAGAYGNDAFDLYDGDGGHEQLHGRPRDERRSMNGREGYPIPPAGANAYGAHSQARGTAAAPGVDPTYDTVDWTRRSADMGPGMGMAAGAGAGAGSRMGDDHYGPGHAGAKVLHRCENCGVDNDISRYFRKEVAYRME